MARTAREIAASRSAVWEQLCDGWLYAAWVVGTARIREVDPAWPTVGSKLHHAVGAWPALIKDETEVMVCEPQRRLRLQARGWPAGEATVDIRLSDAGPGSTLVDVDEEPTEGPGALVHNRVVDVATGHRVAEMLRRLAWIVEGRVRDGRLPGAARSAEQPLDPADRTVVQPGADAGPA